MDIDVAWREALLAASRNLRQNVIKGRIWGPGGGDASPSAGLSSPALPSQPFSPLYDSYSSASSVEFTDEEDVAVTRKRKVRGRVLGMVRSFERSGSFSSTGEMEDDEDDEQMNRATIKTWLANRSVPEDVIVSPSSETLVESGASPFSEPLTEEPTVEALLAQSEGKGSWGAKAWEDFDAESGGVTVKLAEPAPGDDLPGGENAIAQTIVQDGRLPSIVRRSHVKRQNERRVVTAVFAPSTDEKLGPDPSDASHRNAPDAPSTSSPQEHAPQAMLNSEDEAALSQLQSELTETRALVDMFRRRLETVESRMTKLEEAEAARHLEHTKPRATTEVQTSHTRSTSTSSAVENSPTPQLLRSSLLALGSSLLPSALKRVIPDTLVPPTARTRRNSRSGDHLPDKEPTSLSELPQYMLLVGIGVCVVVLRVVLKKAVRRL